MIFIALLTFYLTISFWIGFTFCVDIIINDFNYKEMKLWHLIIGIIFFIGTILGILTGNLIIKINKVFTKTKLYNILNQQPFRR